MPRPEKRPGRLSALVLWGIAGLGLILSGLVMIPLAPALKILNPQAQQLLADAFYYLPFVALPLLLHSRRNPGLLDAYRPNPISLFNVISIVILALLGVFLVNDITVLWSIPFQKLGLNIYAGGIATPADTRELMLGIISMAAIPAICEEFLFRGAVMPAFEGSGTRHAVLVSALLFACLHGSIIGFPAQFILGIVLGLLVFWTDSIYAGLIYHTVHNAAAVILDYLQGGMSAEQAMPQDLWEAIGGMAGALDLLLSIGLSAMLVIFTLRLFRLRGRLRGITTEARKREKLRGSEIIALIAGILICAALYALDFAAMLGGNAI